MLSSSDLQHQCSLCQTETTHGFLSPSLEIGELLGEHPSAPVPLHANKGAPQIPEQICVCHYNIHWWKNLGRKFLHATTLFAPNLTMHVALGNTSS